MSLELGRTLEYNNTSFNAYQNSAASCSQPMKTLPTEMKILILRELQSRDKAFWQQVSHEWEHLTRSKAVKNPKIAFGQKQWMELFKIKTEEPLLPENIRDILNSQCPFSEKGVKIKKTHLLVLLPGEDAGQPLDYKKCSEIIKQHFPELGEDGYNYLKRHSVAPEPLRQPRWILIKKSGFAKDLSFAEQEKAIKEKGGKAYQIPKAVDVIACAITEYARTKKNMLKNASEVYRCKESDTGTKIVVGGEKGFYISNGDWDDMNVSVLPMREL